LRKQLEKLAELVRRRSRQTTRFSRDKRSEERQKAGRPDGHPGAFTKRPDHVDEEVVAPLCSCPHCGTRIDDAADVEQFVVDIPEIKAWVCRIVTQRGWCQHCRRRVRSTHPRQISRAGGPAQTSLGPRALGLAADLKHRMGIPYRKIVDLFRYFGMRLTHGAFVQADLRLAAKGEPTHQAMICIASRSPVVHTDDTGWRIDVESAYLWVFATDWLTVYVVARSRGSDVVLATLGADFGGNLVSDGLPALDTLHKLYDYLRSQCLGHLVRRAGVMEAEQCRNAVSFPRAVKGLLKDAIALSHRHDELAPATMAEYARRIERRADLLLARNITHPDNLRLRNHLEAHRDQLFRCLYDPAVPATNNLAEQQLRGAVVTRKIGGCNRTDEHARAHAIIASVAQTAHRNGHTLTDFVRDWMRIRPPPPPGLLPETPLHLLRPSSAPPPMFVLQ
jgi:hypothetical protein